MVCNLERTQQFEYGPIVLGADMVLLVPVLEAAVELELMVLMVLIECLVGCTDDIGLVVVVGTRIVVEKEAFSVLLFDLSSSVCSSPWESLNVHVFLVEEQEAFLAV
eukprot:s2761_g10.t1